MSYFHIMGGWEKILSPRGLWEADVKALAMPGCRQGVVVKIPQLACTAYSEGDCRMARLLSGYRWWVYWW